MRWVWGDCVLFDCLFKILFIYLTERESMREHKHGELQREREKQTPCWAGSPMWCSIPGPWDHNLNQRQTLNQLSLPGSPGEDCYSRCYAFLYLRARHQHKARPREFFTTQEHLWNLNLNIFFGGSGGTKGQRWKDRKPLKWICVSGILRFVELSF